MFGFESLYGITEHIIGFELLVHPESAPLYQNFEKLGKSEVVITVIPPRSLVVGHILFLQVLVKYLVNLFFRLAVIFVFQNVNDELLILVDVELELVEPHVVLQFFVSNVLPKFEFTHSLQALHGSDASRVSIFAE